jgi:hypothetical protein
MAQSKNTVKWRAAVKVTLLPVNAYGDVIGNEGRLDYSLELSDSLLGIVAKLESLKES